MKKRNDGRFRKSITDSNGKRIYFYGSSEREINKKILEYEKKLSVGRSFSEVADEWWEEAEPRLASQSMSAYKPSLKSALDEFGTSPIKSITPKDIARYIKKLASHGYSQKTISNRRIVINKIFNHAIIEGDVQYNPCTAIPLPQGLPKEQRTAASINDEEKIKSSAHPWLFPLIAIYSGLRKGEILALEWTDIDFENDIIYVTKSVAHNGVVPYIKTPKTDASKRLVPLLLPLKERLLKERKESGYIISTTGDSPLTKSTFDGIYERYQKEVGITATAHQLRHSFATVAIENGVDIKSVSEILGHKQISTTLDIYTDFRRVALERSRSALNSAFSTTK